MTTSPPRLVITPGEPAGIGPDILTMLAAEKFEAGIVAVADPELLRQRVIDLGLRTGIETWSGQEPLPEHTPGVIRILPVPLQTGVSTGKPDPANAPYVLRTLDIAIQGCLDHTFDALVTGPVSKAVINEAGIAFSGHTEYLAEKCAAPLPVMMLANPSVRVALVTTHLPLSEVVRYITRDRLEQVIRILHADLEHRFALPEPAIGVCGLNPHAGEEGHLGDQEKTVMQPVIDQLRARGIRLSDPMPADTIFTPEIRKEFDVILSMYHDQGLPALKALGFGATVNITLGLPIIRTSVDHGTALALAGTGQARPSSLKAAIQEAIYLAQQNSERIAGKRAIPH